MTQSSCGLLEDRRHHVVADDRERVGFLRRGSGSVHLNVASVRQTDARLLLEKAHHLARARKQRPQPLRRRRLAQIHELRIRLAFRHDVEVAGGEPVDVARVRPRLARCVRFEVSRVSRVSRAGRGRRDGAACAHADRRHALRHHDGQVDGRLVSRAVLHAEHPVAGEVARVDGPRAEDESPGRNAMIGNRQRGGLSAGQRPGKRHDDLFARARHANGLPPHRRAVDGQRIGGEANFGEGVALAPERDLRLA